MSNLRGAALCVPALDLRSSQLERLESIFLDKRQRLTSWSCLMAQKWLVPECTVSLLVFASVGTACGEGRSIRAGCCRSGDKRKWSRAREPSALRRD